MAPAIARISLPALPGARGHASGDSEPAAALGFVPDASRFPASGRPGDPAWDAMAPADQQAIDLIAANIGKAFEAYLRKLAAGPSRVDRFLGGDSSALTAQAQHGLALLARSGCLACHSGPLLSDERYHVLGVTAWPGDPIDLGRADAQATLAASEFTASRAYWDGALPEAGAATPDFAAGAFRTPSLRNLSRSAPYGHNGSFATLNDLLAFLLTGGGRGESGFAGEVDPLLSVQLLSEADRAALAALLLALDGDYPAPPWNNWPQN